MMSSSIHLSSSINRASSSLFLTVFFFICLIGITTIILTIDISQQRQERLFFPNSMKPFTRTFSLFNLFLKGPTKNKISPLYLINGTICRYINNAPICTVLATSGLQTSSSSSGGSSGSSVGSSGSSGGSGGGSSNSSSRFGASSGSLGGGGVGVGVGQSAASQSGGSSVQYLGRPLADDSLDLQVSRIGEKSPVSQWNNATPVLGYQVIRRRPLGLMGMRQPIPRQRQQQQQLALQRT